MNPFRNLPVARKFLLAFGLVCILCTVLGTIALAGMARINRSTSSLSDVALPSAQALADMESAMQIYRRADLAILLCDSAQCASGYLDRRRMASAKIRNAAERYRGIDVDPALRAQVETANADFAQYQAASDRAIALLTSGHKDLTASLTVGANVPLYRNSETQMDEVVATNTNAGRQLCLNAATTYKSVRMYVLFLVVVTILLCAVIGKLLTRSIVPPLKQAAAVLAAMADRDLTKTVAAAGDDEIGKMAKALNTAVGTMRELLHSMQRGVETVSSAAVELSARSGKSSEDARQQANETNQIASATQEMAATVAEVSQNAERANLASREAAQSASDGGAVIERSAGRMRCISDFNQQVSGKMASLASRSEQIGKVVVTIREISDQTNLLALNAAIEAQRAGEHGRGFAVVAGEVRRLAERTKAATEEIGGTIAAIQTEMRETLKLMEAGKCGISEGLEESENARRTLDSVIELCRRSEEQIAMIATAETQQAAASKEISQSLNRMSEVSSSLSGAAEETTQASEDLSRLAAELSREINSFHLSVSDGPPAPGSQGYPASDSERTGRSVSSGTAKKFAPSLIGLLVLCAVSCCFHLPAAHAQQLATVTPPSDTPSAPHSASADPQQYDALQHRLEQVQSLVREQAGAIELLRLEIERQNKVIDSLSQSEKLAVSTAAGPAAVDSAAQVTNLQHAVAALRGGTAVTSRLIAAQEDQPSLPANDLFFRIGNATFTPVGWVDFTTYFRSTDVGSGLGTTFQSVPYSNTVQGGESEVRLTAQSSRFGMRVDEKVGAVKAYGYLEADFNGYLPGNAYVSTNSNTLRMRVFYLNLASGKWEVLGGQGWSLLTPTRKALSPFLADLFTTFHLDTSYQAGLTYARQTQFRFVYHPTRFVAVGLSVEDPQQYSGSAVTFPTLFSNTETDINSSSGSGGATATPNLHPDVIAKTTFDRNIHGLYWHVGVAGLLTSSRVFTPASVTKSASVTDDREGGGAVSNMFLELFKGFHLLGLAYWSDGGGRYIGGMGPGFVALQPGSVTSPFTTALIHSGSGIGGVEWTVCKRTTISGYYSGAYFQRRYALDPDIKTPTWVGYGFPGSANTNNRYIEEASFATTTTLWQNPARGSLQTITQSSWVDRSPWSIASGAPKDAHTMMEFVNLRYVLP